MANILQKNVEDPERRRLLLQRCRSVLQAVLLFHLHCYDTESLEEILEFFMAVADPFYPETERHDLVTRASLNTDDPS